MPTGCRARRRSCWRIPGSMSRGSRRSGRSSAAIAPAIAEQLEIDARYAGYLDRQARDIAAFRRDEALLLPAALDYAAVGGLSAEIRGKLAAARPATLGAAARISGVTPAALVALLQYVKRRPAASAHERAARRRRALPRRPVFHVKHWRGSRPMPRCWCAGRRASTWSAATRSPICGAGISSIRRSFRPLIPPESRRPRRSRQRRRVSRAGAGDPRRAGGRAGRGRRAQMRLSARGGAGHRGDGRRSRNAESNRCRRGRTMS